MAATFDSARRAFKLADETLGWSVSSLCWGDGALLNKTEYTQPALLAAELASLAVLLDHGIRPSLAAGHSLGEYGALVASGVMEGASALKLVRARGLITSRVAKEVGGGMAAVLGMEKPALNELLAIASKEGVIEVSNDNAPGQVVISGENAALDKAAEVARSLGAKRILPLTVSGPFHSSLMKPAGHEFERDVRATDMRSAEIGFISNRDALAHAEPSVISDNLVAQLYNPVKWRQCVETMYSMGADAFVEVGPGHVLEGLIQRCRPDAKIFSAEDSKALAQLLDYVNSGALDRRVNS